MKSDAEEPSNNRPTLVKVGRRKVVRIARRLTLIIRNRNQDTAPNCMFLCASALRSLSETRNTDTTTHRKIRPCAMPRSVAKSRPLGTQPGADRSQPVAKNEEKAPRGTLSPRSSPSRFQAVNTSSARSHSRLLIRRSSRIEVIRRVRDRRPLAASFVSPPRRRFSWTYVAMGVMWSKEFCGLKRLPRKFICPHN
jgi:hypothetical protein